jgi:ADP-ribose pyrophosphatase
LSKYETVSSETKFQGKILTVTVDLVKMPDEKIHEREVVKHNGAVGIVPVTKEHETILVKQYRHATGEEILEIPAGKLDKGEGPSECALRELKEETGVTGKLIELAEFYTTPGYSNEFFYLYLAADIEGKPAKPEDNEIAELLKLPMSQALEMISAGLIVDGKSIAGLYLAKEYLEKKRK